MHVFDDEPSMVFKPPPPATHRRDQDKRRRCDTAPRYRDASLTRKTCDCVQYVGDYVSRGRQNCDSLQIRWQLLDVERFDQHREYLSSGIWPTFLGDIEFRLGVASLLKGRFAHQEHENLRAVESASNAIVERCACRQGLLVEEDAVPLIAQPERQSLRQIPLFARIGDEHSHASVTSIPSTPEGNRNIGTAIVDYQGRRFRDT